MAPYLLGFKGPAQCIEFEQKPMKVHMVPRSGASPQVCSAALAHPITLIFLSPGIQTPPIQTPP